MFLEKIMEETLHDHYASISFGARPICNQRFANDIDLMGGSSGEHNDLINRLVDIATACGMEVGTQRAIS